MQPEGEIITPHSLLPFLQAVSRKLKARDRLRRQEFSQHTDLRAILAFPRLYLPRMRKVPEGAIEEEREAEFLVNCACGAHPIIERLDEMFQKCPGCERHYLAADKIIFVLYGHMTVPSAQRVTDAPPPDPA